MIWWNNIVYSLSCNLKIYKRKQLFIQGPTNVGKSSVIEMLIGKHNLKYVYYPGVGKFFMQTFDNSFHKVIVFEEFNFRFYKPSFLKRLLENRCYSYPVKCKDDNVFSFNGPIIFISNEDITDTCYDTALLGRLQIINADCRFWQGTETSILNVKEEVFEESQADLSYESISSTCSEIWT